MDDKVITFSIFLSPKKKNRGKDRKDFLILLIVDNLIFNISVKYIQVLGTNMNYRLRQGR